MEHMTGFFQASTIFPALLEEGGILFCQIILDLHPESVEGLQDVLALPDDGLGHHGVLVEEPLFERHPVFMEVQVHLLGGSQDFALGGLGSDS
jgi:hypothetical protein